MFPESDAASRLMRNYLEVNIQFTDELKTGENQIKIFTLGTVNSEVCYCRQDICERNFPLEKHQVVRDDAINMIESIEFLNRDYPVGMKRKQRKN